MFYARLFRTKAITELSLVMFQLCNFLRQNFVQKSRMQNVDEIVTRLHPTLFMF